MTSSDWIRQHCAEMTSSDKTWHRRH